MVREESSKEVRYRVAARGEEAALILLGFLNYGLKRGIGPKPPIDQSSTARPLP